MLGGLVLAAVLVAPATSTAAPFWIIQVDDTRASFVDVPTIDSMFGMPTVWIYRILPALSPRTASDIRYQSSLTQFDCKGGRYRTLASLAYRYGMEADISRSDAEETAWAVVSKPSQLKLLAFNLCSGRNFVGDSVYGDGVAVKDFIVKVEAQIEENARHRPTPEVR